RVKTGKLGREEKTSALPPKAEFRRPTQRRRRIAVRATIRLFPRCDSSKQRSPRVEPRDDRRQELRDHRQDALPRQPCLGSKAARSRPTACPARISASIASRSSRESPSCTTPAARSKPRGRDKGPGSSGRQTSERPLDRQTNVAIVPCARNAA